MKRDSQCINVDTYVQSWAFNRNIWWENQVSSDWKSRLLFILHVNVSTAVSSPCAGSKCPFVSAPTYIEQAWLRVAAASSLRGPNYQVYGCHDDLASQWIPLTPLRGERHRQLWQNKKKKKEKRQVAADERVEEGGGGWRGWDENYSNHKAPVLCFPHSAWRMHRPHTERDGEVDKKRRRELEEAQLTAWTCHRTHCRSTCCCWMKTQPLLLYSLQVDWYVSCRTTHRDEGCLQKKKMFLYDYLC